MSTAIGAGISGVFGEKPGSGVSAYDNIYSVHFDSPAQRINCGDSSSFSFPGTVASDRAFSISTWVYFVDTAESVQICGKGDVGTADAEYNLDTDSAGRVRIRLYDSTVSSTSTSYWQGRNNTVLETNKWYHIVATFDGTTPNNQSNSIRIYVNNQLNNVVNRVNTPGPFVQMFDNGGKFILGTTDGVNSKNIYMDEAAIFNRALTQADINYLYSIPFTPNLTVNGNFTELGSELILNGDFEELGDDVLTAPWVEGNGWSVITDGVSCDGSVSGGNVRQNIEMTDYNGKAFLLTYTLSNVTDSSDLKYKFGGGSLVSISGTEGTHSVYITNDATVDNFQFVSYTAWAGDITNISLKEVDPENDWTLNAAGDSSALITDKLTLSCDDGDFVNAAQSYSFVDGNTYRLSFDLTADNENDSFTFRDNSPGLGGLTEVISLNFVGTETKTFIFTANANSDSIYLKRNSNGTYSWSIDNVSLKQISGWTFGDGWSVNSSNQAEYDGTGTTASALEQTVATYEDGKKYQVQFQLDGSLNGVAVSINGGTAVNALRSTTDNSSRSVTVIAGSGSNSLKITPLGATDTFTIYDITSKLVTSLAAPNTDKDDARAIDLTGMSDLDHWWRMGDTQGPATYPVIHDVVYNPFGGQLVENGNFDELGPQLIQNPYFNLGPEEVINGDFDTDSDWDEDGSWTYDSLNQSYKTTNNSISSLKQNGITQTGKTYKLTFNVTSAPNGFGNFRVVNSAWSDTYVNPNEAQLGENTFYINVVNGTGIRFRVDDLYEIDNVSVKEVPYWSLGDGWSIENGFAVQDGTNASYSSIQSDDPTTPTKIYKVSIDIDEVSGPVELKGAGVYTRLDTLGVGSHVVYITADASYIRVLAFAGSKIKFKDFFVEQVDPEGEWTLGDGWSIEDGVAICDGTQSAGTQLTQTGLTFDNTKTYKVTYTVTVDEGNIDARLQGGGATVTGTSRNIDGTYTDYLVSTGNTSFRMRGNEDFIGSVDNISVQQVSDTSGIMENMNPDNIVAFSPPDPDPLVGDEFIFSVNTAQTGVSNSDQFQLPLISAGTLDFTVIWGDGTQDIITSYNQAETLHTYPSSGTYTIGIRANTQPLKGFKFDTAGDKLKMSNIVNWGGSNFRLDQQEAFYGCSNMTCTATDAPLITATVFYRMFRGCANFNGDLSNWDVSGVTSFNQMFFSCNAFTGKGLENWDISSADAIEYMFFSCSVFNGQIGGWDTSGVNNMRHVFQLCSIFNQDISSWDTSLVTRMTSMFQEAFEFNQPLNSWDVSSCVDFGSMFKNTPQFNQPLNNWTIKNDAEIDMNAMFFNANRFNQDVSMWDVSRVRYMQYMFFSCADMSFGFDGWDTSSVDNFYRFAGDTNFLDTSFGYLDISSAIDIGLFKDGGQTISTENYNNTLIGWAAQTVNPNLTTSFGSATYSYSAFDARNTLTSAPNNWLITDGGYVPTDNAFQFTVNPNLQTLSNELTDITNGTPVNPTHWANATATSVDFIEVATTGVSYYEDVTPSLEAGEKYKLELTISNYNQIASGGSMGWSSQNTGSLNGLSRGSDGTSTAYFVSPGGPLRIYGRAGVATASMSFSCKKVNSDTNQFELPLIDSGTQDFVVDWGDGTQDKITAWDDAAKLHSYYSYGNESVDDGDFALTGTQAESVAGTYWTTGANITISGGSATFNNVARYNALLQSSVFELGKTYKLEFTVSNFTEGSNEKVIVQETPNVNPPLLSITTGGNYSVIYTATSNAGITFKVTSAANVSMNLTNISLLEQTPDTTPKTISIDGTIQGWQFNDSGDYLKLNNINRWGALDIRNNAMFSGCSNMTCTATDAPTVSTTSLRTMFRGCTNFNGAIGNWDISTVTTLRECFYDATTFNQPLNDWDVSNVTTFYRIFRDALSFDQDLNSWDTSNVERMDASFFNCTNFNGDIYSWDTSKVLNMSLMLYNCDSFDQSLAAWNIESVTNFTNFMQNATGLSTSNYNLTLVSWAHQNVNSGLAVDFGGSQYSAGGAAAASRNILTSAPNNWTISDGGSV